MSQQYELLPEMEELEETLPNVIPPQDIFAFNESRSCADLKRMCDSKQLDISPNFQREEVWNSAAKTRFIDSLLKNLPIPSMCISLDINTKKRVVIDGLQRISTIVEFLRAVESDQPDKRLSTLDDIDEKLSGKSVKEISQNIPKIIDDIENVTIPVTVLRCDMSKDSHMEYIFTIFNRLNTGGTKLNSQEIRNCIFSGVFNDLLFKCSEENNDKLEILLGATNKRFSYEEFILRFFAFQDGFDNYFNPLTKFLNSYMKNNRVLSEEIILDKYRLFNESLDIVFNNIDTSVKYSKVVLESILYGVGYNVSKLSNITKEDFMNRVNRLLASKSFSSSELQDGLFQKNKVSGRFNTSKEVFSEL